MIWPMLGFADGVRGAAGVLLGGLTDRWPAWTTAPLVWAVVLGAASLLALLPRSGHRGRRVGIALGLAALAALMAGSEVVGPLTPRMHFWILASLALGSATAAVSSRSAVYSAVWFALSLVGVSGLFMSENAQFLGVATIVVYAGAIVVTFLFVVMLAQPEGHDTYDRLSWGPLAKPAIVFTAALFLAGILLVCQELRHAPPPAARETDVAASQQSTGDPHHMAALGNQLFGRHLVAVEVAGTLLLAALVGAVAIMIQGREQLAGAADTGGESSAAASGRAGGAP